MNKAKILEYAAKFEAMDPDNFGIFNDMWKNGIAGECGCVAAWICYWEGDDNPGGFEDAASYIGHPVKMYDADTYELLNNLFFSNGGVTLPDNTFLDIIECEDNEFGDQFDPEYKLTPQDVAQCMRNLAETGKVSWDFLGEKING